MCDYIIAENKHGKYCIPKSSKHRVSCRTVMRGDVWEEDTVDFIISRAKNDLIHAGAYFGDMLPVFSPKFENVWAFEPSKENYQCALKTIEINNLRNINLMNVALGKTPGTALLETKRNNKKLGGANYITNQKQTEQTESVKITTIDNVIPSDRIISIIHLDIEDYELFALQGAQKTIERCSPTLILEARTDDLSSNLQTYLGQIGYQKTGSTHNNNNGVWEKV